MSFPEEAWCGWRTLWPCMMWSLFRFSCSRFCIVFIRQYTSDTPVLRSVQLHYALLHGQTNSLLGNLPNPVTETWVGWWHTQLKAEFSSDDANCHHCLFCPFLPLVSHFWCFFLMMPTYQPAKFSFLTCGPDSRFGDVARCVCLMEQIFLFLPVAGAADESGKNWTKHC